MRYVCVVILAVVLGAPAVAGAQTGTSGSGKDRKRTQFIDMDEYFVEGSAKRPTAVLIQGRGRPKFHRLLELRTSFVKEILESAEGL